jgi:hypothetical protein
MAARANLFQISALFLHLTTVLPMTPYGLLQLHLSLANTLFAPIRSHRADISYQ